MLRSILLRIQRGEGWFWGGIKRTYKAVHEFSITPPPFLKGPLSGLYMLQFAVLDAGRTLVTVFYRGPLLKARCASVGRNLQMTWLPYILGPVEIHIGNDVKLFGKFDVMSGRMFARPQLVIGDHVHIGHGVQFTCNREIVIGDHCNIASGVRIADSDGHPRNTEDRIKGLPPPLDEIKPVRIGSRVWLAAGCMIMKGVTVGEGAVVSAGSVVLSDVPPYSVVMGNPARVIVKDVRISAAPAAAPGPAAAPKE